jgi:aryl carrier-like protein
MLKQITLAAILAIGFSTIIAGQTIKTTETERALARLGDLAPKAVRRRLSELRPSAYQPGQFLLNEIIKWRELTVISSKRVERLKAALQPVLAYHERDGKLPIFVVRSEQPKAYVAERAALIITTKLTLITSEAELRGIVAHELAHEYFYEERDRAFKEKDESSLREIELFCDAVAAVTLKEIGDDPACYARALERMTYIGITAGNVTRSETKTHPSLETRVKLNQWLCRHLGQVNIMATTGERQLSQLGLDPAHLMSAVAKLRKFNVRVGSREERAYAYPSFDEWMKFIHAMIELVKARGIATPTVSRK